MQIKARVEIRASVRIGVFKVYHPFSVLARRDQLWIPPSAFRRRACRGDRSMTVDRAETRN
jgi:hypothetical protein